MFFYMTPVPTECVVPPKPNVIQSGDSYQLDLKLITSSGSPVQGTSVHGSMVGWH